MNVRVPPEQMRGPFDLVLCFKRASLEMPGGRPSIGWLLHWASSAYSVLKHNAYSSCFRRCVSALNPVESACHCELMMTFPCTWDPETKKCDAPCGHTHDRRAEPYHVVMVVARLAGVHETEMASHCGGEWVYYPVSVTPHELHRLRTYVMCLMCAEYRRFNVSMYPIDPAAESWPLDIWASSALGEAGDDWFRWDESIDRQTRMRKAYVEATKDVPESDVDTREDALTRVLMDELGRILPNQRGAYAHARSVCTFMAKKDKEVERAKEEGAKNPVECLRLEKQAYELTCVQLVVEALLFSGVLRATAAEPANMMVGQLRQFLAAEGRILPMPSAGAYNATVPGEGDNVPDRVVKPVAPGPVDVHMRQNLQASVGDEPQITDTQAQFIC